VLGTTHTPKSFRGDRFKIDSKQFQHSLACKEVTTRTFQKFKKCVLHEEFRQLKSMIYSDADLSGPETFRNLSDELNAPESENQNDLTSGP